MKNLEQIRAASALSFWEPAAKKIAEAKLAEKNGDKQLAKKLLKEVEDEYAGAAGGDAISKLPSLVVNNGLLATLAFAKSKGVGYEKLLHEVLQYLNEKRKILKIDGYKQGDGHLDPGIRKLTDSNSLVLQRATAEAILYLGYLKRFAP